MGFLKISDSPDGDGRLTIGFYYSEKHPEPHCAWKCDRARVMDMDDDLCVLADSKLEGRDYYRTTALNADEVVDTTDGSRVSYYDCFLMDGNEVAE